MKSIVVSLLLLATALVTGCAPQTSGGQDDVSRLRHAIEALSPDVHPAEAARAAQIAYDHATALAEEYQVTTSPILHNTLVNSGVRQRGLCYHYAEDMQARLQNEGFQSLTILRAIAAPRNSFRIEHSSAVIAPKGADIYGGIVLDPWRHGGNLYWSATSDDPRYDWEPRLTVLRRRGATRVVASN
ncbi:hypothetical protein [Phaeobacter gallaeciensis]|uniref:Lipoprotein n=1 Tax=Phaeobacter gallaeciensis TaxID=60890 RepID=A0AAC9ZAL7_9RHOB|nr:hypothetical protein [Phaeobacter gallaeciensis]AHD11024.1 hypothetical protein Gal_03304 [Phaeobacter gallaeciensis DSM 26640]ATE94287.1 hypothetical protein PhaeoP11_03291 [Phaeobacter gallaeciensis]ATE98560.1 hypothetical protein PhaeoP73_03289 [Phaeobacter gallaeciensis]ATF02951.1 hypothetical protein PhaeoP75_03340 [Phaeobacter gallaeciensis]ATF07331.1 hypothetical protein PhaeoP63_03289 [Phaeobacter gallaeciensis]